MEKLRAAVIGVGYLGRFHAQKYATLPDCTLVGVVDQRPEAAAQLASELGVRALGDYRELFGQVDAVSIVTPTPLHFEMARAFLEQGAHVLVEKPITETVAQAQELIALARQRGRVLQVGHLERFNPGHHCGRAAAALATLHRMPAARAVSRAWHRCQRGARSDDSRSGYRAEYRRQ